MPVHPEAAAENSGDDESSQARKSLTIDPENPEAGSWFHETIYDDSGSKLVQAAVEEALSDIKEYLTVGDHIGDIGGMGNSGDSTNSGEEEDSTSQKKSRDFPAGAGSLLAYDPYDVMDTKSSEAGSSEPGDSEELILVEDAFEPEASAEASTAAAAAVSDLKSEMKPAAAAEGSPIGELNSSSPGGRRGSGGVSHVSNLDEKYDKICQSLFGMSGNELMKKSVDDEISYPGDVMSPKPGQESNASAEGASSGNSASEPVLPDVIESSERFALSAAAPKDLSDNLRPNLVPDQSTTSASDDLDPSSPQLPLDPVSGSRVKKEVTYEDHDVDVLASSAQAIITGETKDHSTALPLQIITDDENERPVINSTTQGSVFEESMISAGTDADVSKSLESAEDMLDSSSENVVSSLATSAMPSSIDSSSVFESTDESGYAKQVKEVSPDTLPVVQQKVLVHRPGVDGDSLSEAEIAPAYQTPSEGVPPSQEAESGDSDLNNSTPDRQFRLVRTSSRSRPLQTKPSLVSGGSSDSGGGGGRPGSGPGTETTGNSVGSTPLIVSGNISSANEPGGSLASAGLGSSSSVSGSVEQLLPYEGFPIKGARFDIAKGPHLLQKARYDSTDSQTPPAASINAPGVHPLSPQSHDAAESRDSHVHRMSHHARVAAQDADASGMMQFDHSPPILIEPRPPTPPKHISEENTPTPSSPPVLVLSQPRRYSSIAATDQHHKDFLRSVLKQSGKQKVLDLLHWRDPNQSGAVLGTLLVTLLILARYSFITIFSYIGLSILVLTVSYRLYHVLLAGVKGSDPINPFQNYLSQDLEIPYDRAHEYTATTLRTISELLHNLRDLIFFVNTAASLKFAASLLLLLFLSKFLSDRAIATICVVLAFSIPKLYEAKQPEIDAQLEKVNEKVKAATQQ